MRKGVCAEPLADTSSGDYATRLPRGWRHTAARAHVPFPDASFPDASVLRSRRSHRPCVCGWHTLGSAVLTTGWWLVRPTGCSEVFSAIRGCGRYRCHA
jgi:hypothetical protein